MSTCAKELEEVAAYFRDELTRRGWITDVAATAHRMFAFRDKDSERQCVTWDYGTLTTIHGDLRVGGVNDPHRLPRVYDLADPASFDLALAECQRLTTEGDQWGTRRE